MMDENKMNISGEAPEVRTVGGADGMEENRLADDELEKVAGGRGKVILAARDEKPKEKAFQWNGKR